MAQYELNQPDFAETSPTFADGNPITGWAAIYNGLIPIATWVTYDNNTGRFTLSRPGVYQIASSIQLFPANDLNPGYNIIEDNPYNLYTYSVALGFYTSDGGPNPLAAPYIGFTRLSNVESTPILTIVYNFYVSESGVSFSVLNTSNVTIRTVNSQNSGTAGYISILRLGDSVLS